MKKILAFLAISVSSAMGQINNPTLRWVGTAPSGSCSAQSPIQVVISTGDIYTCENGTWGKVGGNPVIVPTTNNLLSGNGSGGVSDAGFAASDVMRLSTTQTVTGQKIFSPSGLGASGATTFNPPAQGGPAIYLKGVGSNTASTFAFVSIQDDGTTSGNYGITDFDPGLPAGGFRPWIIGQFVTSGNSGVIQYNRASSGPNSLGLGMYNSNNTLQIFADKSITTQSGMILDDGSGNQHVNGALSVGNSSLSTAISIVGDSNAAVPGLISVTDGGSGPNLKLFSAFAAGMANGSSYALYWGKSGSTGQAAALNYTQGASVNSLGLGFWNTNVLTLSSNKGITTASGTILDDSSGKAQFAGTVSTPGLINTGSLSGNVRTVSTATDTATVNDMMILCNASGAPVAETLPGSPVTGQIVIFKKIDSSANTCTLGGGGFQIDGGTTIPLSSQWAVSRVIYSTNAWYTF
jgi:hypothetical protein